MRWTALLAMFLVAAPLHGQTLAEAAAQAKEQREKSAKDAKDRADKAPKAFTNDNLVGGASVTPPTTTASTTAPEEKKSTTEAEKTPTIEPVVKDETYWRGRITPARARLADNMRTLTLLQTRIKQLSVRVNNTIDDNRLNDGRATIYGQTAANADHTELVRLQTEEGLLKVQVAGDNTAIADIEEAGRKAGALPGWFRER